jgi:hypothetical protein
MFPEREEFDELPELKNRQGEDSRSEEQGDLHREGVEKAVHQGAWDSTRFMRD